MDVEIVSKKENPLLERTEVHFKAIHGKDKTPQRDAVRDKLAAVLNASKDRIVVDNMASEFGKPDTVGYAKVYKTKEQALKVERAFVLRRNGLKSKGEKKAGAPKEAPKKEEKKK